MTKEYKQNRKSQDQRRDHTPNTVARPDLGPAGGRDRGPGSPSCLSSNISIEREKQGAICELSQAILSPYYKRAAQTLYANVMRLAGQSKGIGHLAFITLTFSEDVRNHLEASRRWNSFNSNSFSSSPDFGTYINTKELQDRRKVWHYHIIVQVKEDIRQGFDFPAFREWLKGNNRFHRPCPTGSPYFLKLWSDLNEDAQRYGFGKITSIEPIESTEEAVSRYIGGYIGKTLGRRTDQEKGVRLVNYPKGWVRNSPKFAWNTSNSAEWRRKVAVFAKMHGCEELYQLSEKLGSNWAYKYLEEIIKIDEIYLEHRTDDWKFQKDGTRISRHTGEQQTTEQMVYQDMLFKAMKRNQEQKRQRLREEAAGANQWRMTENQITKKRQEKEKTSHQIEQCKEQIRQTKYSEAKKSTQQEKDERYLAWELRVEYRQKRDYLSDEYLQALGFERKKQETEEDQPPF